jgi:hypothetical protein
VHSVERIDRSDADVLGGHDQNGKQRPNRSRFARADAAGTGTGPTLLKRLFAKEVRVDRSRLLQVFRFLAANDFLRGPRTDPGTLWMFPWSDDPEKPSDESGLKERLRRLNAMERDTAVDEE